MRRLMGLGIVAAICLSMTNLPLRSQGGKPAASPFRMVKYKGLTDEVLKHRGKVILIDIWSIY